MSADVLSEDLKSRLHLKTKTVGQDRIRRARENNEDVAILSMFLPNATAERENKKFCCALRDNCQLGDPRKTIAGGLLFPVPAEGFIEFAATVKNICFVLVLNSDLSMSPNFIDSTVI